MKDEEREGSERKGPRARNDLGRALRGNAPLTTHTGSKAVNRQGCWCVQEQEHSFTKGSIKGSLFFGPRAGRLEACECIGCLPNCFCKLVGRVLLGY